MPSADQLYSVAEIREAERRAMAEHGIAGAVMMARAGAAAFEQIRRHWPEHRRLTVFCGAGNNAGDGYVVARLALLAGYRVDVHALSDSARLPVDAADAAERYFQAGGRVEVLGDSLPGDSVVVDALLGIGLSRPVSEPYASAIAAINASAAPVVALDVPSGLDADTGNVLGCAVAADLTVTFIGLKRGLLTGFAADYCGEVVCDSLALPDEVLAGAGSIYRLTKTPPPPRPRVAHKGHCGHVLAVGGNLGYSGAIRLAGEAALRTGAGLVSIATRAVHSAVLNLGRPELMCHGVESSADLASLLDKASVVVVGPGLGQDAWARTMFAAVLASGKPCVVDADALNLLASRSERRDHWILTPHPGEAARLLGSTTAQVGADRFAALVSLQQRYGGVCVLKGAGSLVGDGERIYVSSTGNPGMASGGMGDVLAGLLGGLLAQGWSAPEAARLGVYVHGEAADRLALRHGERGLLAGDLPAEIRELLN
ncbi:NAD(P)H-hydrate dehydratase [Methylomonas sp. UP202]|uniref:NAD(P)H-hydrate dehydratase n=1 Tax=Methylomonas sp. UP202 TaxID=3040943 RepID=UPI002479A4C7|nr:NAD(P)H-hydrate dehydratase [Methylomonas sp. UP202]WGS84448.1 NAD(P)H-hydrate dehydratase [Methylomonas sp. UP202]